MYRISGLILKNEGEVIVKYGKKALISWREKTKRKRVYYYLVSLQGKKHTKPYRLQPQEAQYWHDQLGGYIKNGRRCKKNGIAFK